MDPESRRSMWDVIFHSVSGKCAAVLTTHSMEEAEALCTRIGIIDKGNLIALGSLAHLKNKFGNGFEIEMTTGRTLTTGFDEITKILKSFFTEVSVTEEFTSGRIKYKVNSPGLKLSHVFKCLQDIVSGAAIGDGKLSAGIIKEYSVSQSSLENIFLALARETSHGN